MSGLVENDSLTLISQEAHDAIHQSVVISDLKEIARILVPGQPQDHLYFIKKGVVRSFNRSFANEWTNWFAAEGDAVYSAESLLNNSPSPEYIETCTACRLYCITRQDYSLLLLNFPELYQLAFQTVQKQLLFAEKRMHGLHLLTAYERYEQFIETHQHIANRVKMQHVASYLGMTATHLSRIRKEFALKDRLKPLENYMYLH